MTLPVMNVAVDFNNNGTWTDVSGYLQAATIRRGSSRVESPIIRYEAGTATLTLDNSDRRFDPTNLTGPYTLPAGVPSSGVKQVVCNKTQVFGHGFTVAVASLDPEVIEASLVHSTVTTSGSTSFTATKPTGVAVGHHLIAFQTGDWGRASSMGTPTGGATWLLLTYLDEGDYEQHTKVWWKVATAADVAAANYGFTQPADTDAVVIIAAIKDGTGTPTFASTRNPGTAFFDTPSISPAGTADYELRYVCGSGAAGGSVWNWSSGAPGYTEAHDVESSTYFVTGSMAHKSLSGLVATAGGTMVKPMRPVRVRAIWNEPGTGTNLITNPGFETDTTGWQSSGSSTIARVTSPTPQAGVGAASITKAPASGDVINIELSAAGAVSIPSGTSFVVSGYVRIPAAAFANVTALSVTDATFDGAMTNVFVTKATAADTWTRFTLPSTVTTGTTLTRFQIQVWTSGMANGTVAAYVDDVRIEVSEHDLFRGYVDSWDIEWNGPNYSTVSVPCTDAFKIFANYERTGGASVGSGEQTGTRVGRVLDGVGWSATQRTISTGDVAVVATTLDGNALDELTLTADTEVGELYMTGDGKVFFRNRNAINTDTRSTTSNATFGDSGSELRYSNLTFSNDDTQMANRVIITRSGGAVQQADDTASQLEFLVRSFERTDLLMTSDAAALNYAQYVLSLSAQPELRFETLEIMPQRDEANLFPQALNRLIGDRITVRRRPPGGGTLIEHDNFIRGIEHEMTPGKWVTRWTLQSTAAAGSFFIIGHATQGKLNRNPLGF